MDEDKKDIEQTTENLTEEKPLTEEQAARPLQAVYHIPVRISAVLGRASVSVNQLLKLNKGSIVELDRGVGDPVDVYVNDRLVARGEVVVVDERLGIKMTDIIRSEQ